MGRKRIYSDEERRERHKEGMRIYRERNREKIREYWGKYYQKNKEKLREYSKEYSKKNKEKINARQKEYREENKEKRAEQSRLRYQNLTEEERERMNKRSREYNKEKRTEYHKVRKELVELMGGKCMRCSEGDYICLDLHHIDEQNKPDFWKINKSYLKKTKLFRGWIMNGVPDYILLVCSNCHRKIHKLPSYPF